MLKDKMRTILWVLLILVLILAPLIAKVFYPRMIVEDFATAKIARVQYNPILNSYDSRLSDLSEYDEEAILSYLATCEEQRTLNGVRGYFSEGDVKLAITFHSEDELKAIHLGNKNYSSGGRYQIKDAERVLATLLTMVNTESIEPVP